MSIDFSSVDAAVELVIAKHDAMFKFDMMIKNLEREELPFPANFALAYSGALKIVYEYNKMIKSGYQCKDSAAGVEFVGKNRFDICIPC